MRLIIRIIWIFGCLLWPLSARVCLHAAERFVTFTPDGAALTLVAGADDTPVIYCDTAEWPGVRRAIETLVADLRAVTSATAAVTTDAAAPARVIVGTWDRCPVIQQLAKRKLIDAKALRGKNEKYIITTVTLGRGDEARPTLVIAGSDKRGAIYGVYELSRQMGVSPWHWWADVPAESHAQLFIRSGLYTDGEPAVRYRGIFINDEWPCMGGWTTEKFGGFNSQMYVHMYELLLRLKANFLWPAMWSAAFYADDPENSRLADEMGIVIGTSHHEPMARNHQEYARHRADYGAWNYETNPEGVERFFREGIRRMAGKEEVVTVAMRGDGDAPMGPDTDTGLLERIVSRQREIIEEETGRPARETPQCWALYSEVLEYYDKGMKIPDDVIILLCDDNWGNVRRLPDPAAPRHPGGYGMYYHVDLHGAPRAYQWLNMTQIPHMWEQLHLTYTYGVDQIWILNVGDLKPNEFPTDFFLQMAWDPMRFAADNLAEYTHAFCSQQFGESCAAEAARILNLYCKYAARVTAEMLDATTYNVETGEWKTVSDEFLALEAHALRLFDSIPAARRDAYEQLVLFPVQAMANLYEMYYAVAMNHHLAAAADPQANVWADRAELCFRRDERLCAHYNNEIADGKWRHLMDQTHIGYTSWDEPRGGNVMPAVVRVDSTLPALGGYTFGENHRGTVVIEAEHFARATAADGLR